VTAAAEPPRLVQAPEQQGHRERVAVRIPAHLAHPAQQVRAGLRERVALLVRVVHLVRVAPRERVVTMTMIVPVVLAVRAGPLVKLYNRHLMTGRFVN
jgi:hypothetical protein